MGRSGKSNDIRTARRVKATLAAKSAASFDHFLTTVQSVPVETDSASAYVSNRALSRGSQRGSQNA